MFACELGINRLEYWQWCFPITFIMIWCFRNHNGQFVLVVIHDVSKYSLMLTDSKHSGQSPGHWRTLRDLCIIYRLFTTDQGKWLCAFYMRSPGYDWYRYDFGSCTKVFLWTWSMLRGRWGRVLNILCFIKLILFIIVHIHNSLLAVLCETKCAVLQCTVQYWLLGGGQQGNSWYCLLISECA